MVYLPELVFSDSLDVRGVYMKVSDWLAWIWSLFADNGWRVFDTFVSFADVIIFVIIAGLFVWLVHVLLGGD